MDVKNSSYKHFLESYMSDHKGSTIRESLILITPYPILIYFVSYIVNISSYSRLSLTSFLIEFSVLIVPVVLVFTIYNSYCHIFLAIVILCYVYSLTRIFLKNRRIIQIYSSLILPTQRRPFITYFRSISSILTAFCILGVDFTIFPRRFAKTESYGFGLMDTGVGFFIISNGLVTKPKLQEHLVKSIKGSIPLIILGIVRCISINSLDYQQHVSEYGIYWNFFFTLAVVKLTCPLILAKWPNGALWTSIALAIMHQAALSIGIEDWIINDDSRDGVLSANKEGFISLPGYLSLYLAAVYIGNTLHTDLIDIAAETFRAIKFYSISIIFFVLTYVFHHEYNVSRRLMNITYITWLLAFTFFLLGVCITVELTIRGMFYCVQGKAKEANVLPIIIDAINYNGLVFFLLANILTGFINISMKTLLVTELTSVLILGIYMLFICFVTCFMYRYRIKIRL